MAPTGEITVLIGQWQSGDQKAGELLFEALYDRLHSIAASCAFEERKGHSLGATALIHEAYIRFRNSEGIAITDTSHFLKLTSRVMRRILVDRARARRAAKRGCDPTWQELTESLVKTDGDADMILAVNLALEELERQSPRLALLVELRFFAGYELEEAAKVIGLNPRTLRRDWNVAKARLQVAINGHPVTQ